MSKPHFRKVHNAFFFQSKSDIATQATIKSCCLLLFFIIYMIRAPELQIRTEPPNMLNAKNLVDVFPVHEESYMANTRYMY